MSVGAAALGARFVDGLAARDHEALAGVLHPEIDFRGLTPNVAWQASDADTVLEIVLGRWFAPANRIEAIELVEHDAFADREQLRFRFSGHNADGAFVIEQQAYLAERDGRIGWMRVVCSGYRSPG
jgi:hypothetical protein